jgi:hypothetical protein
MDNITWRTIQHKNGFMALMKGKKFNDWLNEVGLLGIINGTWNLVQ